MREKLHVVLCRDRHEGSLQQKLMGQLGDGLSGRGDVALLSLPHLYDLAPEGKAMERLRAIEDDLIVACWLHSRAAFWTLDANEIRGRMGATACPPDGEDDETPLDSNDSARTIWCFDLRQFDDAGPLLTEIERILAERGGETLLSATTGGNGRIDLEEPTQRRWYPVVDRDRCGNCLDCLNFCLFGVFGVDREGCLFVESPDSCKDGCPACSRVCPEGAIMFPDHVNPGIAGDPSAPGGQVNLDLVQLFDATSRLDLTEAQRDQIRSKLPPTAMSRDCPSCSHDELDDLVDGLDEEEF